MKIEGSPPSPGAGNNISTKLAAGESGEFRTFVISSTRGGGFVRGHGMLEDFRSGSRKCCAFFLARGEVSQRSAHGGAQKS